jgi:hypothetical protein
LKQLVDAIVKYALSSFFTTRITHVEGEEIFGSCKWKLDLLVKSKGDSHRHDRVNFSRLRVNTQTKKLHLHCEWPSSSVDLYKGVDTIHGDAKVLEAPCRDAV